MFFVLIFKSWCMTDGHAKLSSAVVLMLMNLRNLIRWKVSRLSPAARKHFGFGEVSSLVMVDVYRMDMTFNRAYHLCTAPACVVFLTVYLLLELGWVGVLAPLLVAVLIGCQKFVNDYNLIFNRDKLKCASKRSSKVEELLRTIKVIKFNAWEFVIEKLIRAIRQVEQKAMVKIHTMNGIS